MSVSFWLSTSITWNVDVLRVAHAEKFPYVCVYQNKRPCEPKVEREEGK